MHSTFLNYGREVEKEVMKSEFLKDFQNVYAKAEKLYEKLVKISPDVAQYAVPFGYLQHWYMNMTAREIYWIVELRTGPQGRPHYREICQQIAKLAVETDPSLFQMLLTDMNDYSLSRRESEKKIDKKLREIESKK
jgi:thymidylate synthase ThyX